MSLSLALGSALSGLSANEKQMSILSRNIEMAQVANYVRKDIGLSSRIVGGHSMGVMVTISRNVDERLIRDVRSSMSENAGLSTKSEYMTTWATKIGQPQDEASVSSTLNGFKIAMQTLEGNPGSQVDQLNTLRAAEKLAGQVNDLYQSAKGIVQDADQQIGAKVDVINTSLKRIDQLNKGITNGLASGSDGVTDLMDERDRLVDQISSEIGITTYTRENGEMVVMAKGGATLLDSSVNLLEHTPMGDLRTADGTVLTPSAGNPSGIKSGALAGLFGIRDDSMPSFMNQLDNMASGIVRMFEGADASLAPGQAGLFTDNGNAFDPAQLAGLAGRLKVNDAVRPAAGGDIWKISSGVGATAPAAGGDSTQVSAFLEAFTAPLTFGASDVLPESGTLENFTVSMVSYQQSERTTADSGLRISTTTMNTLTETRMNRDGVNVNDELLKTTLVQNSYTASSAVVKSVQEMLDVLMAST